jgi:hypothetical protein
MRMKVAEVEGRWGGWKGRKEGKERAMDDATFLYPAKAAAGPCARLARCGGSRFPDAGLPSSPLLNYIKKSLNVNYQSKNY